MKRAFAFNVAARKQAPCTGPLKVKKKLMVVNKNNKKKIFQTNSFKYCQKFNNLLKCLCFEASVSDQIILLFHSYITLVKNMTPKEDNFLVLPSKYKKFRKEENVSNANVKSYKISQIYLLKYYYQGNKAKKLKLKITGSINNEDVELKIENPNLDSYIKFNLKNLLKKIDLNSEFNDSLIEDELYSLGEYIVESIENIEDEYDSFDEVESSSDEISDSQCTSSEEEF